MAINRTPGEFINWGLLMKFRVFSMEILQKEGKAKNQISGQQAVYKSTLGGLDCLLQVRGFRT